MTHRMLYANFGRKIFSVHFLPKRNVVGVAEILSSIVSSCRPLNPMPHERESSLTGADDSHGHANCRCSAPKRAR